MIKNRERLNEALQKLAGARYQKILCIDVTADEYEVLSICDNEQGLLEENSTPKLSEWFARFAEGPLCYDNDRERFRAFTDLKELEKAFDKTADDRIGIVYRRKFNLTDSVYSTVSMELFPFEEEDGHKTAYLSCPRSPSSSQQEATMPGRSRAAI